MAKKIIKVKRVVVSIFAAAVFFSGLGFAFYWSKDKAHRDLAARISEYGPRKGVPQSIDDLKRAISAYEDAQEMYVRDAAQTGTYWKILATRFQDKLMWLEAVKALERAIQYTPNDETLHYLTGMDAAMAAKSVYDYDTGKGGIGANSKRYFNLSEAAYLRALELQPAYTQARYALAILYTYELNRPADAISHFLLYMEERPGDADAMFALGRALYMTGRNREAVEWFDRGISLTKDAAKLKEARILRDLIMDSGYL